MEGGSVCETLVSNGYSLSLRGFSALDRYLGREPLPFVWAETSADISTLARLFEGLRFPGVDLADSALEEGERSWYFRCRDPREEPWNEEPSFRLLSFAQDWNTGRFQDPWGLYPQLRELRDGAAKSVTGYPAAGDSAPWWKGINPQTGYYRVLMDGALVLARYGVFPNTEAGGVSYEAPAAPAARILQSLKDLPRDLPPNTESLRVLLTSILISPRPDLGMELLKAAGFVETFWPELAVMDDVDHSKEYHPEGNVWKHTLETFRYRKPGKPMTRLSLGLLLHDVGKPLADSSGSRRFDGHAELGARAARKFLTRLEFDASLIDDVCYLVKNHMLPAALPRLPRSRTGKIMDSPLFPILMELYRCDESSSFKDLGAYHESSAAYRSYLRCRRNPPPSLQSPFPLQ
jgi:poly(A) polymerase